MIKQKSLDIHILFLYFYLFYGKIDLSEVEANKNIDQKEISINHKSFRNTVIFLIFHDVLNYIHIIKRKGFSQNRLAARCFNK